MHKTLSYFPILKIILTTVSNIFSRFPLHICLLESSENFIFLLNDFRTTLSKVKSALTLNTTGTLFPAELKFCVTLLTSLEVLQ